MSLITCPDCHRQVSSKAAACPQCGRSIKPPAEGFLHKLARGGCWLVLILVAFFVVMILLYVMLPVS